MAENSTKIVLTAEDRTSAALQSVTRGLQGMQAQADLAGRALGALGVTFSAAAAVAFVKGTIDAADGMNDLSQKVGIGIRQAEPDLQAKLTFGREMPALAYLQAERDMEAYRFRCELELGHDILINPTIPVDLPPVSEPETFALRLAMTPYTRAFNHLGWPSCTTRDGLMISGRDAATVMAAALAWEQTIETPVETC